MSAPVRRTAAGPGLEAVGRAAPPPMPPEIRATGRAADTEHLQLTDEDRRWARVNGSARDTRGRVAVTEGWAQAEEAMGAVLRPTEEFLRFPLPSLDRLTGPIPPGQLWFFVGFSGQGKTTLFMSLLDLFFEGGKSFSYLGLESRPSTLRVQWAVRRLQRMMPRTERCPGFYLSPGQVAKGALSYLIEGGDEWAKVMADALLMELSLMQRHDHEYARVRFVPEGCLTEGALRRATNEAVMLGHDFVIVDHIDHIDPGAGSPAAETKRISKACLDLAQETGLTFLVLSQANADALKADPLGMYRLPRPEHVWMGQAKRQVADGMVGLARKVLPRPAPTFDAARDKKQRAAYSALLEASRHEQSARAKLLVPGVMQVGLMKDRDTGREGETVDLFVEQGRVIEVPAHASRAEEQMLHDIGGAW